MNQNDDRREDLDREMERDTEIRRDTQVRGSLGMPPSRGETGGEARDRDEGVPEFERGTDLDRDDRMSER